MYASTVLKQLYISNKMECFSYKSGCGVTCNEAAKCVTRGLKEELAWVIDKRLQVISKTMLFKTVIKPF